MVLVYCVCYVALKMVYYLPSHELFVVIILRFLPFFVFTLHGAPSRLSTEDMTSTAMASSSLSAQTKHRGKTGKPRARDTSEGHAPGGSIWGWVEIHVLLKKTGQFNPTAFNTVQDFRGEISEIQPKLLDWRIPLPFPANVNLEISQFMVRSIPYISRPGYIYFSEVRKVRKLQLDLSATTKGFV